MAKLNKTQINAVCEKLRREFEKKLDAKMKVVEKSCISDDKMDDANRKYILNLVKESNLHDVVKKYAVKPDYYSDIAAQVMDSASKKELTTLGVPYPDTSEGDIFEIKMAIRDKFDTQIEDLKFELVMAGSEDYQDFMKDFEKAVAKLLD